MALKDYKIFVLHFYLHYEMQGYSEIYGSRTNVTYVVAAWPCGFFAFTLNDFSA
jgi:hypothetical protein